MSCLETRLNQLKLDVSFIPQQKRSTSCVINRRVSWADMPADILFNIFGLLRDINNHHFLDLFQCLAVCRTWRFVAKQIWQNHILPTTPWLLQEERKDKKIVFNTNPYMWHKHLRLDTNDEESSFSFDFNSYRMKMYASYDGWLLLGTSTKRPLLYNPITKLLLQLPPLPTDLHLQLHSHMKFVSSRSRPTDPDCIICLKFSKKRDLFDNYGTTLIFCRPALSSSWLRLEEDVEDIMFCGGQFYAIAASGALFVYNDDIIYGNTDPYTSRTWLKMKMGGEICGSRSVIDVHCFFLYLVESKNGEILMIKRILERDCEATKSFCIFKLKYWSDTIYGHYSYYYWDEISSLPEKEALLLGWNDCSSISMDEHSAYKSNCIYFYDEDLWGKVVAYGMYDLTRHSILKKSEESDLYNSRFFNPSKLSNL
ncbi:DUF295 domain-containing protein [Heracleum sosnowskyi]|uniref:DUF295 domain-containing protein n=1 Tax=Heracleum sosnowskyi TaxID=360622 RepID=A0AAD8MGP0_9APIA|nr:DUF295 domain-containing protein [Heracleum sosnowskyi]